MSARPPYKSDASGPPLERHRPSGQHLPAALTAFLAIRLGLGCLRAANAYRSSKVTDVQPEQELPSERMLTATRPRGTGKRTGKAAVDGYRLWCRIRDRLFCVLTRGAFAAFGS